MKFHVIGHKGVVGSATLELFRKLGHEVTGSDKDEEINLGCDIYFVCVPEDAVNEVVLGLERRLNFYGYMEKDALIVIRSSVIPGTCKSLMRTILHHVCHNPEFLREATALQDEFNPERIIIGACCPKHSLWLEHLYIPLQRPIVKTDPTTSELAKLASNNYLSTVISYWNFIEQVAQKLNISGHEIGMIASLDPRISPYGSRFHTKYGGRCLPKDAQQLIEVCEDLKVNPVLIKAVEEINASLKEE